MIPTVSGNLFMSCGAASGLEPVFMLDLRKYCQKNGAECLGSSDTYLFRREVLPFQIF